MNKSMTENITLREAFITDIFFITDSQNGTTEGSIHSL